MNAESLREEIIRLAPWHLNVEVTPEISTGIFREGALAPAQAEHAVSFIDQRATWHSQLRGIYRKGLEGRTLLDCACNCGAYSFWAKELGGGGGLGFDVRQHWIDQARFLQANRTAPSDGLRFEVSDLYDLPKITDEMFDISLFKGLFYHLPDPIHGLQLVADRTRELLIVNTTTAEGDLADGMLVAAQEAVDHPMSGVHGLSWFPTGPQVIRDMLVSMGFPATRCRFWLRDRHRVEVIGAREESTLELYDTSRRNAAKLSAQPTTAGG